MFEISAEDFNRAKEFYESILKIEITEMNVLAEYVNENETPLVIN